MVLWYLLNFLSRFFHLIWLLYLGILGFKLKKNSEIIVDDFEFEQSLVVKPSYQSEST